MTCLNCNNRWKFC
ncbi:MAG: hypothetical protein EBU90_19285 [Proteobacteria bacterium]|nr:hypothetical protein [Pseudomonadota bacterium]NBP13590.1 hypothetical protein [bacterium]